MKNTKSKLLGRFWKKSKYIENDYEEDLTSIIDFYKEKGYRDARILLDTVKINGNLIDLDIDLAEGNKYYFGDIKFLGNLPQKEIKDLMNKSKLLIHTSQYETFGLVAIEANSMGLPILSINTGSLIEIIENNKNGYFAEDFLDIDANNFVKNLINIELICKN